MPLKVVLLLLGFFTIGACTNGRHTPAAFPAEQLRFGTGGGFTGAVREFILLRNGQVFVIEKPEGAPVELPRIGARRARRLYDQLEAMDFRALRFEHPGNRYHFITLRDEEGEHRVVWGDPGHPAPPAVLRLFGELQAAGRAD